MTVNRQMLVAEADHALHRFLENIGGAGEAHRPVVMVNDTSVLIYQRRIQDDGIEVIGVPRGELREFIARLEEAGRRAPVGRIESFQIVTVDDEDPQ